MPRASALPKSRERTGCAENRNTGKRRVKSPLSGREGHAARPLQKGNGRAAGNRVSKATICWRITSQFDSLLLCARPHKSLGQVATFGTADKSSYQPWLFVMLGCKKPHPSRQKPPLTSLDITRIMSPCPRASCVLLLAPHGLSAGGVASLHQKRIKALFDNTRPPPHLLSLLSGTAKSRGTRRSDGPKNRGNSGRKVRAAGYRAKRRGNRQHGTEKPVRGIWTCGVRHRSPNSRSSVPGNRW